MSTFVTALACHRRSTRIRGAGWPSSPRQRPSTPSRLDVDAVVLACGGFESNPAWRARYLGPGWESREGPRHTLQHGRRHPYGGGSRVRRLRGNFSGCHAVAWDMNAPEFGDLDRRRQLPETLLSVRHPGQQARDRRFVDEGADFRNYTYARYGREVLNQPGQCAWQIFDAKVAPSPARRIPDRQGNQGHGSQLSRNWRTRSRRRRG